MHHPPMSLECSPNFLRLNSYLIFSVAGDELGLSPNNDSPSISFLDFPGSVNLLYLKGTMKYPDEERRQRGGSI